MERDYELIGKLQVYRQLMDSIRSAKVTIADDYSDELKLINRIIENAKEAKELFIDIYKKELEYEKRNKSEEQER